MRRHSGDNQASEDFLGFSANHAAKREFLLPFLSIASLLGDDGHTYPVIDMKHVFCRRA
jgi:hypothetical protein